MGALGCGGVVGGMGGGPTNVHELSQRAQRDNSTTCESSIPTRELEFLCFGLFVGNVVW